MLVFLDAELRNSGEHQWWCWRECNNKLSLFLAQCQRWVFSTKGLWHIAQLCLPRTVLIGNRLQVLISFSFALLSIGTFGLLPHPHWCSFVLMTDFPSIFPRPARQGQPQLPYFLPRCPFMNSLIHPMHRRNWLPCKCSLVQPPMSVSFQYSNLVSSQKISSWTRRGFVLTEKKKKNFLLITYLVTTCATSPFYLV
jgi:hypothetical protein